MKVALVISSLGCGGAERVLTRMAAYWVRRGWDVTLITFDDAAAPFYAPHSGVRHCALGLLGESRSLYGAVFSNVRRIARLRHAIQSCSAQAVISFVDRTNVSVLLATMGTRVPVLVAERCDPAMTSPGRGWSHLRRWVYGQACGIVVQTRQAGTYFGTRLARRIAVIPNPVLAPENGVAREAALLRPMLIAMGRLVYQKGFDLLLDAFARVTEEHSEWRLIILGEGPQRAALESQAARLGLDGRVTFPGQVRDPAVYLLQSDLFVLPSRFEGFPNALTEAMACGLPVIAADCPSGPRDIVRHECDGLLVPPDDVRALTEALARLMGDVGLRRRLGSHATKVVERFSMDRIMALWADALEGCVSKGQA